MNRRSHGAIIAWPNRYMYEDIMRAFGDVDVTHLLVESGVLHKKGFPIVFHGIKGLEKRTRRFSVVSQHLRGIRRPRLLCDPHFGPRTNDM